MRKNVVLLLVALSCATSMFGQNNTDNIAADIRRLELYPADISTASQKNLKGIVFSVTHGIYEYKENFGDPAPGNLEQGVVTYYDETGSPIKATGTSYGYSTTYVHNYTNEGGQKKVTSVSESKTLERTYTGDIVTTYTVYHGNQRSIEEKLVGKQNADKTWSFKWYGSDGNLIREDTRTYDVKGRITKLVIPNGVKYGHADDYIHLPLEGIFKYDDKGRLISYQRINKNNSRERDLTDLIVYNEKGDLVKTIATGRIVDISNAGRVNYKGKSAPDRKFRDEHSEYENYKYDDHGNWIYRVFVGNGNSNIARKIEKREIVYCNSVDELKAKAAEVVTK